MKLAESTSNMFEKMKRHWPVIYTLTLLFLLSACSNGTPTVSAEHAAPSPLVIMDEQSSAIATIWQQTPIPLTETPSPVPLVLELPSTECLPPEVKDNPDIIYSLYVPDMDPDICYTVVQQDPNNTGGVSTLKYTLTQSYATRTELASTTFFVHDYVIGPIIYNLHDGGKIFVITQTGRVDQYHIEKVLKFQAVDPVDSYTPLIPLDENLNPTGPAISYRDSLSTIFPTRKVSIQTCLRSKDPQETNPYWGRTYFIASVDEQGIAVTVK